MILDLQEVSGIDAKAVPVSVVGQGVLDDPLAELSRFRVFYHCTTARRDALFELTDAALCTDGPVKTLVGQAPAPGHRRGPCTNADTWPELHDEVFGRRRSVTGVHAVRDDRI
ncbi:hypothetical protein [Streptomyces sp. NPDC002790]|uniref:hypothetical protein n=1 Tax=Streptomyces sp. NPDC002790 TaxID=3154431 RepID=UPI00332452CC